MRQQGGIRTQTVGSYVDLVRDVRSAWKLLWDRRVPLYVKAIPFLSVAYVLMPLDLLPDLALGLGQLDDLAIVLLGTKLFLDLASGVVRKQSGRDAGEGASFAAQGGDADGQAPSAIDGTYGFVDEALRRAEKPVRKTRKLL